MREKVETIVPEKLRDVLVTRTAIKTFKSEDLVEKVIVHQFRSARDAFKQHNEVEISGFGKFLISVKRTRAKKGHYCVLIERMIKRLEGPMVDWQRKQFESRLAMITAELNYLKTKER